MNTIKKIALTALSVSLLSSVATVASAKSISGSTDFRVTLPEVLVLYHWDDAHLTLTDVAITPDNDSDKREISDTTAHDLTEAMGAASYTITGDVLTPEPTDAKFNDTIDVTLENSWAVRSLSSAPVSLALSIQESTLLNANDDNSKIEVTTPTLASTGTGVTVNGTSATIPSGWTPVMGDINFTLDLSAANNSGEYNTRGAAGAASDQQEDSDTFLLTLTGATTTP